MDDTQMNHHIMCNSYLREVVDGVCYQGPIGNNLFVITNKHKVVYIEISQTPCRWVPFHVIGVMECCIMYVVMLLYTLLLSIKMPFMESQGKRYV